MVDSRAWGKLIHEKNWSQKSRGTVPLTQNILNTGLLQALTGPILHTKEIVHVFPDLNLHCSVHFY